MKQGHRLSNVPHFPSAIASRLASLSISTAEEFVSQSIGDPEPMQRFLGLDDCAFSDVIELAESSLDPQTLEDIRSFRPKRRSYGAWNPHSAEFDSESRGGGIGFSLADTFKGQAFENYWGDSLPTEALYA